GEGSKKISIKRKNETPDAIGEEVQKDAKEDPTIDNDPSDQADLAIETEGKKQKEREIERETDVYLEAPEGDTHEKSFIKSKTIYNNMYGRY
uniref:DNA-binding protein n=1 Tax=Angiostrongylus cantonensis TaxID=6313 RepID=A0A0K0DRK1_ANGCA